MKRRVKHPHVEAICGILHALGASVRCHIQRRVVIWFQIGRCALQLILPSTPHDPERAACQACRQLERLLREHGYAGAAA